MGLATVIIRGHDWTHWW